MNEYQTLLPLHMYLYFTFVTLSSYKSAKTAETSENLPFEGDSQGRFAKHLRFFYIEIQKMIKSDM